VANCDSPLWLDTVLLYSPLYHRMHAVLRGLALTLLLASQSVAFAMPSANAASSSSSSTQKGGQGEAVGFGGYEHIPESERAQEVKPGEVPLLPEPKAAAADAGTPTLKLGETMKFAELGPIIVNSDGTTRRITNWSTMTDAEQAVTLRRIGKRNQERMADLKREADSADTSGEL
jgi:hypothetical protein